MQKYRRARRKKKKQSIDLILQNMKFSARSESSPESQVKESNPIANESDIETIKYKSKRN